MKTAVKSKRPYPSWCCSDCGKKYKNPKLNLEGHIATYHYNYCGVCNEFSYVTEPRDFGHPKFPEESFKSRPRPRHAVGGWCKIDRAYDELDRLMLGHWSDSEQKIYRKGDCFMILMGTDEPHQHWEFWSEVVLSEDERKDPLEPTFEYNYGVQRFFQRRNHGEYPYDQGYRFFKWAQDQYEKYADEVETEAIHGMFGLSYASYQVIPRSILQSMPPLWQLEYVKLMEDMDALGVNWPAGDDLDVSIKLRKGNRFYSDDFADYERGRRIVELPMPGSRAYEAIHGTDED